MSDMSARLNAALEARYAVERFVFVRGAGGVMGSTVIITNALSRGR